MHISDQIGFIATPIVGILVFGAPPATIGALVALQSFPHLIGSLPSGLLVDKFRPEFVAIASAALSTIGFALVAVAVSNKSIAWFGVSILLSGLGVVVFVLAALSLIPRIVAVPDLAVSNARIEFSRAIAAVAAPLLVGLVIDAGFTALTFALASIVSAIALVSLSRLTRSDEQTDIPVRAAGALAQGVRTVARDRLLRPVAATAVLWNLAFAVLIVAAVPYLTDHLGADSKTFGLAMSSFGVGSLIGIGAMRLAAGRIQPRLVLLFGPGISALAATGLYALPAGYSTRPVMLSFFLLGFGPSMWLVAQNTIRQAVTPKRILGSVNAVIQTGIYGSRPVGAVAGGLALGATNPRTGVLVVSTLFACSFAAAALSELRNVRTYEKATLSKDGT